MYLKLFISQKIEITTIRETNSLSYLEYYLYYTLINMINLTKDYHISQSIYTIFI